VSLPVSPCLYRRAVSLIKAPFCPSVSARVSEGE
jgi:hypothetical protein